MITRYRFKLVWTIRRGDVRNAIVNRSERPRDPGVRSGNMAMPERHMTAIGLGVAFRVAVACAPGWQIEEDD